MSVTSVGMAANMVLACAKISAGLLFASQTILADGLHSASDLITDVAVLAGLRVSDRPADESHHYGHRRVATLVAMVVGVSLVVAALVIGYRAILTLRSDGGPVRSLWPLCLAAVSIPVKEVLFRITRHVGRRTSNLSLMANAWHHRSDAFTSVAAFVGLGAVAIGGAEWRFLDQITALVLSAFLIVAATRFIVASTSELIDRAPAADALARIEQAVANTDGVQSFHAFRARQVGGRIAMDVHVQVDGELTVHRGHAIASEVRSSITEADNNVIEVIVHVEPSQGDGS